MKEAGFLAAGKSIEPDGEPARGAAHAGVSSQQHTRELERE